MKAETMKNIALQQLDKTLAGIKPMLSMQRPARGWLRAIRDALGMSGPQMAKRMNMTRQGIAELEKSEISGAISLNTLQRAAEALDSVLVYAVVPRDSLQATVERQARKWIEREQAYASHTMLLENQLPPAEERRAVTDAAVADLIRRLPKRLWD